MDGGSWILGTHKACWNWAFEYWIEQKDTQVQRTTCAKIEEEEGRAGRKDLCNTKQVVLERSKIGKSA